MVVAAEVTAVTHGAATIAVVYVADGGGAETTPSWAAQDSMLLPVLGLQAQTDHAFQVVISSADGGVARSGVVGLSTGALPSDVPSFVVTVPDGGAYPSGFTLVARVQNPSSSPNAPSPALIVNGAGRVVWYVDPPYPVNGDFEKQSNGTYTFATRDPGPNPGLDVVPARYLQVDDLGNTLHLFELPDGGGDGHEFLLLDGGDFLMTGATSKIADMTAYGGTSNELLQISTLWRVQPDGGVAFYWNSDEHIPYSETTSSYPLTTRTTDPVHINGWTILQDGNYLVSARDTSTVYKLDATTGEILWRLGGKSSDFTFPDDPLGGFWYQHHARELPNGDISLFDDGNDHSPSQSRAVVYRLDTSNMQAHLVWSYAPGPSLYSWALGSVQPLPDGNWLVDFGTTSTVQEVDPTGQVVWQLGEATPPFGYYRALHVETLY